MFLPRTHLACNVVSDTPRFNAWIEQHRKTDAEVDRYFGNDAIMFTGPAGTTFWEDTRGFHKGLPPTKRARLAFEVVYTVIPKFDHPEPISRQGSPDPLTKYSTRYIYDWKE